MLLAHYRWFWIGLGIPLILQLAACAVWRTSQVAPSATIEAQVADIDPLIASLEQRWVISAAEAKLLVEQGATLLDARQSRLFQPSVAGAIAIDWRDFTQPEAANRGKLLKSDAQLTEKLQALGISQDKPVIIFADPPNGWGEEGRIAWMLRTLGHGQAVIVDGGIRALAKVKIVPQPTPPGNFVVRRRDHWDIHRDALKAALTKPDWVIVDTREPREFAGATPYGEQRGGHVPGAINLYFKTLLTSDGTLHPPDVIRDQLNRLGIEANTQIVVYCTGGIRSGWLAAVLTSLGFSVQNYAGSMWEWSAGPADQYPLHR